MRLALAFVVLCAGCDAPPRAEPDEAPAPAPRWRTQGDAERGRALFEAHECRRCHERGDAPEAAIERDCVGCHRAIVRGDFEAPEADLAEWRGNLRSLVHAPSLEHADRLSRDWVARFLLEPYDVRPGLPATMPRLDLDAADAADLATFLVPSEPTAERVAGDAARGRRLVHELGCGGCHAIPGREPPALDPREAVALAPDLGLARERLTPATLLRELLAPRSQAMPRLITRREDAADVAAYLLGIEREDPSPSEPERLPLLDRPVSFAEVQARVLRRVCWHCHSDADLALGDGGPGNTGGLGFGPRGLDLSDYAGVMNGALDERGERRSIFRLDAVSGEPLLVAALLARREEERGAHRADLRGMPLGLPSLSPAQIQLVESWIAQGRPQ